MESLETLIKRSKWVNYQSPLTLQFREPLCLWFAEFLLWGCEVFFPFSLRYFICKMLIGALCLRHNHWNCSHFSSDKPVLVLFLKSDYDKAFITYSIQNIMILRWRLFSVIVCDTLIVASGCEQSRPDTVGVEWVILWVGEWKDPVRLINSMMLM